MKRQLTKADEEFQMFADYYKIYQQFYTPEESDDYWKELVIVTNDFCLKYKSRYARDIIFAYIDSRERIYKARKEMKKD